MALEFRITVNKKKAVTYCQQISSNRSSPRGQNPAAFLGAWMSRGVHAPVSPRQRVTLTLRGSTNQMTSFT